MLAWLLFNALIATALLAVETHKAMRRWRSGSNAVSRDAWATVRLRIAVFSLIGVLAALAIFVPR